MKVKLQAQQMWDAVEYGNIKDHHEDWRALEALLVAIPSEMPHVLVKKPTRRPPPRCPSTVTMRGSPFSRSFFTRII